MFHDLSYVKRLKQNNLKGIGFRNHGYKYGTEWLHEEIPAEDLNEITNRLK